MLIVGNWKAYIEKKEQAKSLYEAAKKLSVSGKHQIVIAPPLPYIGILIPTARGKVGFAAQDISNTTGGAETGETTAAMLAAIGVTHTIVGHSERRKMGETDEIVASKVSHALAHGLIPIVCIGERVRDEDAQYLQFLRKQLTAVYDGLTPKERLAVIIAYEPIWAIGPTATGAITPEDLEELMRYIRKILTSFMPGRANEKVQILYGGSVDDSNVQSLTRGTGVDGLLIGRASTDPKTFTSLVKKIS